MPKILLKCSAFAILIFVIASCNKKKEDPNQKIEGTYFPVVKYFRQQWKMIADQPYSYMKVENEKEHTDTSYVSGDSMEWVGIIKAFCDADISDKKYIGHYDFSSYEVPDFEGLAWTYEAKDDNLFTQRLDIIFNLQMTKVLSIYIETKKVSTFSTQTQKLYYSSLKTIQIQQYKKSIFGSEEGKSVSYYFM